MGIILIFYSRQYKEIVNFFSQRQCAAPAGKHRKMSRVRTVMQLTSKKIRPTLAMASF